MIGYRATGKSTVGRIIAAHLRVPFADTDQAVEAASGLSIAEYFHRHGEGAFRDRESEALRALCQGGEQGGPVVATGGGIVLRAGNMKFMRERGRVLWLTASAATIRSRLAADPRSSGSRPPLAGRSASEEVADLLSAREPLYRSGAHATFSTEGRAPEAVAGEVVAWLKSEGLEADPGT